MAGAQANGVHVRLRNDLGEKNYQFLTHNRTRLLSAPPCPLGFLFLFARAYASVLSFADLAYLLDLGKDKLAERISWQSESHLVRDSLSWCPRDLASTVVVRWSFTRYDLIRPAWIGQR